MTFSMLPGSVTRVDWNGDLRPDIATANFGSNSVTLLPNRGSAPLVDVPPTPLHAKGLAIERIAPNPSRGAAHAAQRFVVLP